MTNKQKIAELEKKLRRYEKKIEDMQKINAKLREQVEGLNQIRAAFDAWIIQVALAYGEDGVDQETGEKIPRMKVLNLSRPKVFSTLRRYEVHRWVDKQTQTIHIGVGLRDDPRDHKSDAERAKEADNGADGG